MKSILVACLILGSCAVGRAEEYKKNHRIFDVVNTTTVTHHESKFYWVTELMEVFSVPASTGPFYYGEPRLVDSSGTYKMGDAFSGIAKWVKLMKESVEAQKNLHPALQKVIRDYEHEQCLNKQETWWEYKKCFKECARPENRCFCIQPDMSKVCP